MDSQSRRAFLILVLAQAAHSVEEYVFRLYEVFPPARFVSSLISEDLRFGFAVGNTALVTLGFWCYLARVRPDHPAARGWAWLWVCVEAANGVMHSVIALGRGAYFPGVWTAPLLLATSLYVGTRLLRTEPGAAGT
jgi:hypothetical protein